MPRAHAEARFDMRIQRGRAADLDGTAPGVIGPLIGTAYSRPAFLGRRYNNSPKTCKPRSHFSGQQIGWQSQASAQGFCGSGVTAGVFAQAAEARANDTTEAIMASTILRTLISFSLSL